MPTKIAINGLGRIGRPSLRMALENPELEVVAVNDLAAPDTIVHLLKHDSVYGNYEKEVSYDGDNLIVDGEKIDFLSEKDPSQLPWDEKDVDVVLECTGVFRHLEDAQKHREAGAKQVVISAPGKGGDIPSYVLGVNEDKFSLDDEVIDMGSCTTNCLAPVADVLNREYGIDNGFMTTIHSYTSSQSLLDLPQEDLRRARAAAENLVPTTTGAAKAIGKVIPELDGKLDGMAVRAPTPVVSLLDAVFELGQDVTKEEVNETFEKYAQGDLEEILDLEHEPLVSMDFKQNSHSAVIDARSTRANKNLVKILAWYDNEHGYARRLVDFAEFIGSKLSQ
ncbi:MAG: type I glyceraldehyde-3-phosphate dehydrogenase [Candidatus Paceibacterota bacterium]